MNEKTGLSAVILAGGFGTRLSPLTDTKPKPLVRILDVTVLENTIDRLLAGGFCDIVVSTHYKSEMVNSVCSKYKNVICKRESVPLGTAGGVKNCCKTGNDAVLVVSGDAVFDFDLRKAVEFHIANKNDVTIVGSRKENPTEYGVMLTDSMGNVTEFCEKPSWKKVRSDMVNTGIYVLSRYAVDRIPDNMKYDFSKNLFPALMKEGRKISVCKADGFWCDVGSLDEYYECNRMAASGLVSVNGPAGRDVFEMRNEGIHASDGVYVSENAYIGRSVCISDASVVCGGCRVADECDISGTVMSPGTTIGRGTSLDSCIVCENVSVGENCIIPKGSVIGGGAIIEDGVVLDENTVIGAFERVKKEDTLNIFKRSGFSFVDDGMAVCSKSDGFADVADFAKAVCLALKKSEEDKITAVVSCDNKDDMFVRAFLCGMGACSRIFDAGCCDKQMMRYASGVVCADVFVIIESDEKKMEITLLSQNGENIDDNDERKIIRLYNAIREDTRIPTETVYPVMCQVPVKEMYVAAVEHLAKKVLQYKDMSGINIYVRNGSDSEKTDVFKSIFPLLCGRLSAGMSDGVREICFSESGAVIRNKGITLDENHMRAVVLSHLEELGINELCGGKNMPSVLREIAGDRLKEKLQDRSIRDGICDDGIVTLVMFLAVMALCSENEEELLKSIPSFGVYSDEYIADINRGATMERLSALYHDSGDNGADGIRLFLSEGTVTVVPNRAKGFKIVAEAVSMESAKELAFKIGKAIKNEE